MAVSGAIFFACFLALTYASCSVDSQFAWSLISIILLILTWRLGSNKRASLAAVICSIAGAVIPIFGLLVPYSGITLSIAGLLSAV